MPAVARPLQVQVDKLSVKIAGKQFGTALYSASVRLRCWPAGASIPGDPTFLDVEKSYEYKEIDGWTVDQQLTAWVKGIKQPCQRVIDDAILEDALLNNAKFDTVVSAVQSGLTG